MTEHRRVLRVVRLLVAQQAGQLPGREHQGPAVGELRALGDRLGVIGPLAGLVLADTVGGSHAGVPEVGVAGLGQRAVLAGPRPGLGRRPRETRELGPLVIAPNKADPPISARSPAANTGSLPGTVCRRVVVTEASRARRWSTA